MFVCAMVPGDEAFRANVLAEAADVIRALRHHPSIALWCGNNECEEGWFHMPKDLESLLWLSQVLQAEGMRTAVEHFRSQRPRVMGALYRQFEDCWPVASWSGIDSTGAWKALHYYARRFYAPVLVAAAPSGDDVIVSAVSDLPATRDAVFEWTTATYDGRRITGGMFTVKIEPLESKVILTRPSGPFSRASLLRTPISTASSGAARASSARPSTTSAGSRASTCLRPGSRPRSPGRRGASPSGSRPTGS